MKKPNSLVIALEIEHSKLNREKSLLVLDKAIILYMTFLFVAVVGFINQLISLALLNLLVIMGLCVLIIGVVPYVATMHQEERRLLGLIENVKKGEPK